MACLRLNRRIIPRVRTFWNGGQRADYMIELHERLSEYSYGYGVTRETEILLEQSGMKAVPFMPNLIHEKKLGFDVGFNKPGAALMLQFKLGQSLQRFHNTSPTAPRPSLDTPFWRFSINTAEADGQFETLLNAELDGAEVYYVAPRFSDWSDYGRHFETGEVLDNSVLIQPSVIRYALDDQGAADGPHRIVYDRTRVHVCSEPRRIKEIEAEDAVQQVSISVRERQVPLGMLMEKLLNGLNERSAIRRERREDQKTVEPSRDGPRNEAYARAQRERRLIKFMETAETREHAVAATLGVELWTLGIQLLIAVEAEG